MVGGRKRKEDSLWFSGMKGERESNSGSGEERGRAKVCSAPVRRGVNEGKRGRGWGDDSVHCTAKTKGCDRLVRS